MTVLIDARAASKHFPVARHLFARGPDRFVHAVDEVDLELHQNETLALVGESGSGKTTLGLLMLGLQQPSSGVISWEGKPLGALKGAERGRFRRDVQVIFQNPYGSLNPRMTIGRILRRPLARHRIVPAGKLDGEVGRLLELVGLAPAGGFIDRYPHELSGGQRQRVAIARALSLRPRVIVADEPVSSLDVSVRAQILSLLREIKDKFGLSMLFTTHDLGVVRFVADRVAVMYLGKIVEVATRTSFFAGPRHPYARILLGSALSPNPQAGLRARDVEVRGEPPSPVDPPSGCRFRTRCPHAVERCVVEEPKLRVAGEAHRVACHLDFSDELTRKGVTR